MSTSQLNINSKRLEEKIYELAQIGRFGETGVCRLALSPEYKEGIDLVKSWMDEIGLKTRVDNFGNLIGRLDGKNPQAPALMLGSHIDSQPNGGRYDGPVGVLGALEAVQTMMENKIEPEIPIEIMSFCDEEGYRFGIGLFGSRGILGQLNDDELERADKDGVTRREAIKRFGGNPDQLKESEYKKNSLEAYIEMHIEQGPILEDLNLPAGIVKGISGPLWLTVELTGFAGHAGTVPMHMRNDALVGAAKVVTRLNEIVKSVDGPNVGTVGNLQVSPSARAVIPEKVVFSIDLRDIEINRRNECEQEVRKAIQEAADENGLNVKITEDSNIAPQFCNEDIIKIMHDEGNEMGINEVPELVSGAFHDALPMADLCPMGMIFVQSKDGISHNPEEYSKQEDIAAGTELLYRTALRIATKS